MTTCARTPAVHAFAPAWQRLAAVLAFCLSSLAGTGAIADTGASERIREHMKLGELKAAALEARSALQTDPGDDETRRLLVETYLRIGAGAAAEQVLVGAQAQGWPVEEWLPPMARAYLQQGKAQKLLQEIELAGATSSDARAFAGLAHLALGDVRAARAAFEGALDLEPDNVDAHLGLAQLALGQGDHAEAEQHLAAAKGSDRADVWLVEAARRWASGDPDGALRAYTLALVRAPGYLQALLGRAMVQVAQNRIEAAVADLDRVRALVPGHPHARFLRALADYRQGDLTAARDRLNRLLARSPDYAQGLLLAGLVQLALGEYEQAEKRLTRAVAAAPDNAAAVSALATVRLRQNEPDKAIELLEPLKDRFAENAAVLGALGSAYLRSQRYEDGVLYTEKALGLSPDAPALKLRLALGHLATDDPSAAIDVLESIGAAAENLSGDDFLLLVAQLQTRQFERAIRTAGRLEARLPEHPAPAYFSGLAQEQLGRVEAARADFERALAVDPDFRPPAQALARLAARGDRPPAEDPHDLGALLGRAELAAGRKDFAETIRILEEAREAHPDELLPGARLVRAYLAVQRTDEAVALARALLASHPQDPRAVAAMVLALVAREDLAEALRYQEMQVRLSPESPDAHSRLAVLQLRTGREREAGESLERALALDPDHVPTRVAAAELAARAGRTDEALTHARRIQTHRPESPLGHQLEGDVLLSAGAPAEAAAAYGHASERRPSTPLLRKQVDALRRAGRNDEALQLTAAWLPEHPDDTAARLLHAGLAMQSGRGDEAARAYEQVLARKPGNLVALNNLAWLYNEQGDPRAVALAERAHALAPETAAVADTLGWVLVNAGETARGLKLLEEAFETMADDPSVRYHLAVAYKAAGRPGLARRHLKPLLEREAPFPEREQAQRLYAELGAD